MDGWSEGQCQSDIGTSREKEVVTLGNVCLWRGSSWDKDGTSKMACAGLSPCHFNQGEGQAREETLEDCSWRKRKPAVCPFAERGEAKGA